MMFNRFNEKIQKFTCINLLFFNFRFSFLFPFFLYFNLISSLFLFPFSEIWDYFHSSLLKKYASVYNGINVVSGPVFDYNYDGHYDTPEQIHQ